MYNIISIEGATGNGKTYHVVSHFLITAIIERRPIFTNIEGLNVHELSFLTGVPPSEIKITVIEDKRQWERMLQLPESDREYKTVEHLRGAVCIVDEAQLVWFTREYKNMKTEFFYFLTKTRHIDCQCIFITQHIDNLDIAIRRLSNVFYSVTPDRMFGFLWARAGRYCVSMRFDADPHSYKFTSNTYRYEEKYFRCYCSAVALGHQLKQRMPMPRGLLFAVLLIVIGLLGLFRSLKTYKRVFKGDKLGKIVHSAPLPDSPHDLGIPRPSTAPLAAIAPITFEVPVSSSVACRRVRVGGCFEMGGKRECDYGWACR